MEQAAISAPHPFKSLGISDSAGKAGFFQDLGCSLKVQRNLWAKIMMQVMTVLYAHHSAAWHFDGAVTHHRAAGCGTRRINEHLNHFSTPQRTLWFTGSLMELHGPVLYFTLKQAASL